MSSVDVGRDVCIYYHTKQCVIIIHALLFVCRVVGWVGSIVSYKAMCHNHTRPTIRVWGLVGSILSYKAMCHNHNHNAAFPYFHVWGVGMWEWVFVNTVIQSNMS